MGDRTVDGLGGRKLDDDRTILERLDADHVRLLAEIAQLKDAMRWVVNELRKTARENACGDGARAGGCATTDR